MEIKSVEFRSSALTGAGRPKEWIPQIAVAGRSNVGKSSLLNWLCRRTVARVAKAPGKTRALNFFMVNGSFFLVDLPGYGYAKVAADLRRQWGEELGRYLRTEERLAGVVTLIDIRHEPTALDLQLQQLLLDTERRRLVVLTKADKVGRSAQAQRQLEVQRQLAVPTPPLVVSVQSGAGRRQLLDGIAGLADEWRAKQRGDNDGAQEEEQ